MRFFGFQVVSVRPNNGMCDKDYSTSPEGCIHRAVDSLVLYMSLTIELLSYIEHRPVGL